MADDPLPYPPHDPRPGPRNADGSLIDGPPTPVITPATPEPLPKPAVRPAPPASPAAKPMLSASKES